MMVSAKKAKLIRNLKIYAIVAAMLAGGFFVGKKAYKQIKICIDAHALDSNISDILSEINYDKDNNILHVAAHRGFSSKCVENTVQAISEAASQPYIDSIEIDVRMTKDGCFVLSHDNIVYAIGESDDCDEFIIKEMVISQCNFNELVSTPLIYCNPFTSSVGKKRTDYALIHYRILKLRDKGYYLAGLKDGIKACGNKGIILDLKVDDNDDYKEYADKLLRELNDICKSIGIDQKNVFLTGFNIKLMRYIRDNSDFSTGIIVGKDGNNIPYIDEFDIVAINYNLIISGDVSVDELQEQGKKVFAYTLNTMATLGKFMKFVDDVSEITFVTNFPDSLVYKYQSSIEEAKQEKTGDVPNSNEHIDRGNDYFSNKKIPCSFNHNSGQVFGDTRRLVSDICMEEYYKPIYKRRGRGRYPKRTNYVVKKY